MQDSYVSLNPANAAREESAIRSNLYRQRLLEAQGGAAAPIVAGQWGLTAAVLTYANLQGHGFSLLPFSRSKAAGYGKIGATFAGFWVLGHSYVMGQFGDKAQYNHLFLHKSGILAGTRPWDRNGVLPEAKAAE